MVEGQGDRHVASADISVSHVALVLRPQTSTPITSTLIPYLGVKCPNQIITDIPPWRYINGAWHPIEEYSYLPTPSSIMVVGNLNDFEDKSSYDVLYDTISKSGRLFALPTTEELRACWELCRLHNNIGFWVVWLPTGEPGSGLRFRSHYHHFSAWSIAMAYHAQTEIIAIDALTHAARYVPLCFGIKSLVSWPLILSRIT